MVGREQWDFGMGWGGGWEDVTEKVTVAQRPGGDEGPKKVMMDKLCR